MFWQKSSEATSAKGYDVLVVGGPIYAGTPASTIQAYLNDLHPLSTAKIGAFGYGSITVDSSNSTAVQQDVAPLPAGSTVSFNAVAKITSSDNIDSRCQEFVTQLLK